MTTFYHISICISIVSLLSLHSKSHSFQAHHFTEMAEQQTPATQKAWRVVRRGRPEGALHLDHSAPVQSFEDLKQGEVLVKVHAAALNPVCVFIGLFPIAH